MAKDRSTLDLFALDLFANAPEPQTTAEPAVLVAPIAPEPRRPGPQLEEVPAALTMATEHAAFKHGCGSCGTAKGEPCKSDCPELHPFAAFTAEQWLAFAEELDTNERYRSPEGYSRGVAILHYESHLYDALLDFTPDDWKRYNGLRSKFSQLYNPAKEAEFLKKHRDFQPLPAALTRRSPSWFYYASVQQSTSDDYIPRLIKLLALSDEELAQHVHVRGETVEEYRADITERLEHHQHCDREDVERARLSRLASRAFIAGTLVIAKCLRCSITGPIYPERPWCIYCHELCSQVQRAPVAPKGYEHPSVPPRFSGWDEYYGPAWSDPDEPEQRFPCLTCGSVCNMHGVCLTCLDREPSPLLSTEGAKARAKRRTLTPAPEASTLFSEQTT